MAEPAIEISGLRKVYHRFGNSVEALKGVGMTVDRGEVFGLLGPNGAGKTTTVGACTTRVRPTSGRVVVEGVDVVADDAGAKRVIGVVTQFRTLDRSLNVHENLRMHCLYFGMGPREAKARADELLVEFRLSERAKALPDELSGGMAQRLQVARAIAHNPRVLFLDEPTAGLDPQSRLALWELIETMKHRGITVFLTTHYMEEADRLCDRVAIIDHGQILVTDTPEKLKRGVGAETIIDVSMEELGDDLLAKLSALPGVVRAERTQAGARLMAASADGLLVRVVEATQGREVRDIAVTEPTLETVFISLTGRDLRE
jgi:ABC-2 type transport system ATP-binding protein